MQLRGRLYEAGSSGSKAAYLSLVSNMYRVAVDDERRKITWGQSSVEVSDPVPGLATKFAFPDGSVFETYPEEDVDSFLSANGLRRGMGAFLKARPKAALGVVFATICLPIIIWFSYLPAMDAVARALPQGVVDAAGAAAVEEFEQLGFMKPSTLSNDRHAALQVLFSEVAQSSGAPPGSFRFLIRNSPELGANALAFPDGTIMMTDQLIKVSQHPDELAGVMAHEIVHVTERHGMRNVLRTTGILVFASAVFGDAGFIIEIATTFGAGIAALSYSREFELEADAGSGDIMRRMERNPTAVIDLLRRMHEDCKDACEETSWLSTHPGLRERQEAVSR